MRERERERETRVDSGMLCVIYWLNEGCLSQFRQQGFSTLPARICNSHDTGRLTDLHWAFVLDLPQRCWNCRLSITEPSAPEDEKKIVLSLPCAERHVCVISCGDSGGEWSSCHQIPADAPTVIHWRLSCREKTFIRSSQSERLGFFFYHQRKGSVVRCRLFHVNHNNGVSVIISPQADLPPSLPSAFPSAASQGLNFPVMRTT